MEKLGQSNNIDLYHLVTTKSRKLWRMTDKGITPNKKKKLPDSYRLRKAYYSGDRFNAALTIYLRKLSIYRLI